MIKQNHIKKYGKKIGYSFLILVIIFILFSIYINKQDLSSLNMKNSNRRKIETKYSDENMKKSKENIYIYKQNNKLKNYSKKFRGNNNFIDVTKLKSNIQDYKKKIKHKKNKKK